MPQHKYLIMAENKSLSFPAAFALLPAPLIDPPRPRSLSFRYGRLCEMDLMNFLSRFIAAIRPSLGDACVCLRVTSRAAMLALKSYAACMGNVGRGCCSFDRGAKRLAVRTRLNQLINKKVTRRWLVQLQARCKALYTKC